MSQRSLLHRDCLEIHPRIGVFPWRGSAGDVMVRCGPRIHYTVPNAAPKSGLGFKRRNRAQKVERTARKTLVGCTARQHLLVTACKPGLHLVAVVVAAAVVAVAVIVIIMVIILLPIVAMAMTTTISTMPIPMIMTDGLL
jgi:hypothetical protein